ncbi:hypothetical protein D7I45_05435 [Apilactobacillus bombintestini]|uniref:Uncharacterized protein n=2 Tax=Apilactobacillus bombintestini TaxID=2419772 RepID=A0A387ASL8_9LACO|nr:hypothetical protein D7I45_05435 [Apilactobacillus bombintestini]
MKFQYWSVENDDDLAISHFKAHIDDQTEIIVNPCFEDYMLIQTLIEGYVEMTEINKKISADFMPCDFEEMKKY